MQQVTQGVTSLGETCTQRIFRIKVAWLILINHLMFLTMHYINESYLCIHFHSLPCVHTYGGE